MDFTSNLQRLEGNEGQLNLTESHGMNELAGKIHVLK